MEAKAKIRNDIFIKLLGAILISFTIASFISNRFLKVIPVEDIKSAIPLIGFFGTMFIITMFYGTLVGDKEVKKYEEESLENLRKNNYKRICEDFKLLSLIIESEINRFYDIKSYSLKGSKCYFVTIDGDIGDFDLSKIKNKEKIEEIYKLLD